MIARNTAVAKKKPRVHIPTEKRWAKQSPGDFRNFAKVLEAHAEKLKAFADDMDELGAASARIDGATKFDRADALLRHYLANLNDAIAKRRFD